uniref:Uncharacterized protein n=1 Tax=Syphacia muris TaxID=451379 RepID=A0A0N5AGJ8_9BILA
MVVKLTETNNELEAVQKKQQQQRQQHTDTADIFRHEQHRGCRYVSTVAVAATPAAAIADACLCWLVSDFCRH